MSGGQPWCLPLCRKNVGQAWRASWSRHTFCHTSEFSGAPRIPVPLFHEYWPMWSLLSRVTRRVTIDAQNRRFSLGQPSHCSWPFCIWQCGGRWRAALPCLEAAAAGVWCTMTGLKSSMFHMRTKAAVLQRCSAGAKRKKEVRRSAVMLVWHSGGQTAIHHHALAQHSSMLGLQRLRRTLSVPSSPAHSSYAMKVRCMRGANRVQTSASVQDLGDNACTHGPSTVADGEAKALAHGNRQAELHRGLEVVTRHDHLRVLLQLDAACRPHSRWRGCASQ